MSLGTIAYRLVVMLILAALAGCAQLSEDAEGKLGQQAQTCSPQLTMDNTIQVLKDNGRMPQSQWATAGAVAKAESELCARAQGPFHADGSVDRGLYQINSVHGYSVDCLFNAACNTNAAVDVYERQGWNAWTVYKNGDYSKHLSEAQAAVERVSTGGGGDTTFPGTTVNTGSYTGPYNLRSGPGTNFGVTGSIGGGVAVSIVCQSSGTTHTGPYGSTSLWDKLSSGQWISDAYVYTGSNGSVAPPCN